MNIADILRNAAAQVRRGWCQHVMFDESGGACALGAIEIASCGYYTAAEDAASVVERYIWRHMAMLDGRRMSLVGSLVQWNDAEGQTAEAVAQGLEDAARWCEQEAVTP